MSLRSIFSKFDRKPPSAPSTTSTVHTTSGCKRYNHPEFQIRVSNNSAVPAEDISLLLRFFEQRVAQGEKFQSGESLQVGWMFTMLEDAPGGFLRVLEPDMKARSGEVCRLGRCHADASAKSARRCQEPHAAGGVGLSGSID